MLEIFINHNEGKKLFHKLIGDEIALETRKTWSFSNLEFFEIETKPKSHHLSISYKMARYLSPDVAKWFEKITIL